MKMKVVILAGGLGTRIGEETATIPKPMVDIGGKPILWHLMKLYSSQGFNDFILCLGYKGYILKEYFSHYFLHMSDVTFDMSTNKMEIHNNAAEPWKVTLLDTGNQTMTGGRIKRVENFIDNEPFMLTYGDGLSDVPLDKLLQLHKKHGKYVTMTSVQPEGRYGSLDADSDGRVNSFIEKPKGDNAWINAGFFVCQPEVMDYLKSDLDVFEEAPLEKMAREGQLYTYRHHQFWRRMDTQRDKQALNELWQTGKAPWKKW